ncbi:tenascin-X [Rhynchonycteris naso]
MMPAPCSPASSLALLLLLGTVSTGPFSPRSNTTLRAPRPPPQPGGRRAEPREGIPSPQLYEHIMEGGEKQVVFTHRINLPPSTGCGCPPGTEPPVPASEVQALRIRLEILEELVKGLKEQCAGGCCPAATQAGTGQTDVRSLCSLHGVFDLSRCACSCEPGWGGPICSDPTDVEASPSSHPSAPVSCPDDCNDQGRCVRGRCVCFPGYSGPSCGWPSCPADCHGRGRCVQGVCVCRVGFSGDDCSLRSCPRGCSQRGRCEDGRCVCDPGYTGEDCGARTCPRGCSQRGRCEDGRCVCDPGYTGEDCGARTCPRGCSQRGRCEDGRCVCDSGYAGEDCAARTCPHDCGDGGRCVDGRCVCWPGYAGEDCGTRTCPRDCRGRGRCEDGECICDAGYSGDDCGVRSCPGDCSQRGRCEDGRCVCWPGYTGPDCSARACPRDCRGRGRCESGVCVCNAGYSGEDCGVRSCPGDCRGRGRCESGRCVCWPGYTGRDCGARACPGDCRGRGRCVDGRCVCNAGFTGEDCGSRRCPGDCRGRGRCEDGVCACDAGYEGQDCGARSCPGACRGRGQCRDGHCVCDDGYSGDDCSVRRCPRDCSQRGVCQDGVCACWEGYAGEDCGLRTCPSNCHRRGRCEDGRCVCDPGYTGPSCGTRTCPADCRGRGRCVQGVCACHAGYSGEDCGQEEPPASACPGGCGPRELCRAGQCVCVEGFRGPDCSIQTCPGDCRGRGECREGICICQEGYAGDDCGDEMPAVEGMRMHLLEETTVRTEWTRAPGAVDAYEIQFIPTTEGASPPFTARVPSSASAYDQRGLAPGQEYQVTVRALRGTNWGPPASKTITTMIDGPQDLRVVAVTPTTLELSWLRPQAEVDRFVVSYVTAGNQRVRLEVPPEADGTLLTDLMPGVEYVVTVTAERGRAVSYPASVRANTAPGHYSHPEAEARPPAPRPRPRPRPVPVPLPPRAPRPAEEGQEEPRSGPPAPPPPRRPWGNLTAELGRFRGTVQDLERLLRARGYPLPANQTYVSVARRIHEYLQRRLAAAAPAGSPSPAPPPRRLRPTASPDLGSARKRDSDQGGYDLSPEGVDGMAVPRHPKPEVLGSSADGSLLLSLDGLRGHFERVVLRWQPQPPADGPRGQLTVPGSTRTVSLPDLRPGTTYHVEVHGVRAGQTSKSYAFIITTGSSPSGLSGATDEPPPSGPSTTQGAQASGVQQRPQELGELKVLGKDKTGRLRVAWTAQPDAFAHFQLRLWVPGGQGAHEEMLPGDVRQASVPSPPPGATYELSLRGVPAGGEPSAPLIYQGIMDRDKEQPGKPSAPPRLGELTVTDMTPSSLVLHWTVPEGEFDSFVIQYKDRDGPHVVPVEGPQRSALVTDLDIGRKYKFVLYGFVGKKRHGPLVAEAKILPQSEPSLGTLWVTDPTPHSLRLSWTVPEGQFDSFVVQYKDRDGQPREVPVEGPERSVTVSPLDPDRTYTFTLFGVSNKKRQSPLTAEGTTAPQEREEPRPSEPQEPPQQPRLGQLTVTDVSPDSLRLSWTVAQGDFSSFMIQYKDAQGQPRAVPVGGDETAVTIPGLAPDRKYKMNLYGLAGRQRVGPVSVVATTAPQEVVEAPSPTEPSGEARLGELTVTGSSPDSLSLSWTVPEGHFDHFLVQYKNGDGQPKAVRVPGHEDGVTVSGLEPDHKYKMHLYGFHAGQRQGPVSAIGVTAVEEETPSPTEPSTEAPGPPEEPLLGELTLTGSSPDSLSLSWTVPRGHFDSFAVQYKDGDGRPQAVRVGGEEREVIVQGLEPGRKYKMHLYGLRGGRRVGPVSTVGLTAREYEAVTTQVPTTTPEPPTPPRLGELTVTDATPDSLSLSWTVPEGHFDHFLVQYKNGDGQPKAVRVPGHEDGVTVSGLEPDHKYKLHLYGFHAGQRQGPVSAIGVTAVEEETPSPIEPGTEALGPPEEPLLGELTLTGSSPDSLSLSWTVPRGHFDSFAVQYKDGDGRPQAVRVGGEEREVIVQGLEPGRKYKMHLYGLHGGRRVGPVSTVGLTALQPKEAPAATEPPHEPRLGDLTVTDVTPGSVDLAWTVLKGQFDSFVVQYKDRDGQLQVVPVAADQREATVPGLEPARRYKMSVYGLHSGQRVGPVSVVAMTAPLPTATATESRQEPRLGELTVTDITADSVGLTWTVPEGAFDSFVVQYKDRDGQLRVVPVATDQREATVPGLEPDRKYKFLLYGIQNGKRRGPITVEARTGDAIQGAPPSLGELWVTDPTLDSLRLSWTVPKGHFDSFVVQFKDRDGPRLVPVEGHERSVTISPLDSGHKYRFLLYGLLGKKRHGPLTADGTTETQSAGPQRPSKPRLGEELRVTSVTPDSMGLAWTVPEGQFDSFVVQYKDRNGQPRVVPVEGGLREITISGLDAARRYKLLLYGVYEGRRVGPVSTVAETAPRDESGPETTVAPSPLEPEPRLGELSVDHASPHTLTLSWSVTEGAFDSFEVHYTDQDGQPQAVSVDGHRNDLTLSGLASNHRYLVTLYGFHGRQRLGPIRVEALTVPGEDENEAAATATPEPPTTPRLGELTVTDATPDSLSLSWTVPEGHFDHFLVQYKNGDGQPKAVRVPGHEDGVTVSGLEPDHKYKMHLYGFHAGQRQGPVSAIGVTAAEEKTPSPTEPGTEAPGPPEEPLLGELTLTGSSPDSLSLSWTVPRGHFDSFAVQYKDGDGRPQAVRVGGEEREVIVQGLEPGRKYKMHLYGLHGGRRVGPVSTVGLTAPEEEPPAGPALKPRLGELTVTDASPDSLSLSWTVPEGHFDHFLVQYKNGDGQPKAVRVPGHEDGVTVSGLEPDHKYKMHLYGFHAGQRQGPVSTVGLTDSGEDQEQSPTPTDTPATTPEPPTTPRLGELTVTDATPDSLSLSWTVPEGHFDHFLVQYKNGDGQPKAVRVPGHEDGVTVSGLWPDHKYKMHLYGFHAGQRQGPVSAIGVTAVEEEIPSPTEPSAEAPGSPEEPLLGELTLTGSSPDSLSLSWTVPRGHFDSFSVQYKDGDGRPQALRVGGEEREVIVQGLEPGRKYKMHLYGLRGGRRVGPVSTVGLTASLPTEPPVAPLLQELAVGSMTSDTVHLSWVVAQGPFDSFLIQYRDGQGQPQTMAVDGELHEATISGLAPARKYKFLLFGMRDGKRHGPLSADAKTLPDTKPSPRLGELTVTEVTPDSVGLAWTVPQGEFDSFVVRYKDRHGQPQVVPVTTGQLAVTVSGLEPNRKYKFQLYGLAGRRQLGPVSAEGTTAPLEEWQPSPRLGELTVTDETPDSLRLAWTVAQGPFDSFVVQYRDTNGQPQAVPMAADQREATIDGLEPGRKYKFLLYGLLGGQRLGPVSVLGVTAPEEDTPAPWHPATEAPEPPEGPHLGVLAVTDRTPDSLHLEWTVAQGPFDSFVVQYWDPDGQPQALLVGGDQNKVLVSGLEPSTLYRFFLYGLQNGKRLGPISAEGSTGAAPAGQTPGEPGPRLSQLSVTDVTTSSLRLNWEAPPGAFDSFLLRYGVPSESTLEPYPRPLLQREVTVPGTRHSAVLRDLRPGTLYSLTLYGLRGPHKADSVQGTARTLSPVLESPRDLQFSEIGETSATVSWTPPPSLVDSFKVSYQLADGGEPQSVKVDGRTGTQKLKGLIPGAHYEVTVVSVRGFEESEPLTGFFTTVPDGPTQLRALNLTEGAALLHWKPPRAPVDSYDVQVTGPGAPALQASAPGSAVDYPVDGLTLHINYTATVHGLRGPNLTSPASVTFTTGLEGPRDLQAKEVTPRTALLTWTKPQVPPTGYLLTYDTPGGQIQEILLRGDAPSHQLLGLFPSTTYSAWLRAAWGESFSPPIATSFTTGGLRVPFPRDCGEETQNQAGTSRTTTIFLNGNRERPLNVFCDMETDGGGWLVFQRRMDGHTDFWRDWEDYAQGFGNISGEFWLGNEALHSLTSAGDYSMRVDLRAGGEAVFAQYDSFRVDSAADYYRLHLEGYRGTAGDSMSYHSGSVFSARDRDPNNLLISCAVSYRGAWWYRNCHYANLNGLYGSTVDHQGVSWYHWKGFDFSVPFTEMKLRPRGYRAPT